ncbi:MULTISPECIES: hypothetical protein [Streptomyces rochei group]|uniref:hypothetical protein n=1 Tax=Streptomyces rochei group TaxID=2867164 RepID=UPI001873A4D0|nr:hypothetical protein [Streptomyces vinaceusdrappus]GHC44309.1 hypothetical protein GCM10010308_74430 [Streptomyces vinaceusdrappus]
MSTPKAVRGWHRKNRSQDTTRNNNQFRIEATWPARPDRPAARATPDRAKARRIATQYADQGAYVLLQRARGFQWRTVEEFDGTTRNTAGRTA